MNATVSHCPSCGAPVEAGRTGDVCAACLLLSAIGEASAAPLGSIAGHELIEEIARGGMGVVYRARQAHPEREVALKALPGAALLSVDARERFRIEAQAMARLDHPHILPIYELGDAAEGPFFTMKLASGGSLAQRIGDYAGRWREIAELVATVAEAVQFAHEHGVLHRDLKPGNILFDEAGTPFVCDFGLAKIAGEESDLTRSIALIGTPNYVAPEMTTGAGRVTTASDVWALGVILYELLAGQPPFRGENVATVLRQIVEEEPPPLASLVVGRLCETAGTAAAQRTTRRLAETPYKASIPRDLAVIAFKALQKDPARRFTSARELADDLRRWLRGEPIEARPVPLAERAWLWAKRRPALAALSLALAMVLSIGSVLLLQTNRDLRGAVITAQTQERRAEASLRESLISQARLMRQSTQLGQRFKSLELLRQAVAVGGPSLELRHEAAAALARPDLELVGELARFQPTEQFGRNIAVTPDLRLALGLGADDGEVALCELGSGRIVWRPATRRDRTPDDLRLSDSGQYAALLFPDRSVEIWDTGGDHLVHTAQLPVGERQSGHLHRCRPFHLHASLPLCAGVDAEGTVWVHDLVTREHTQVVAEKMLDATGVFLTEAGDRLAVATGTSLELWVIAEQRMPWRLALRDTGELLDAARLDFLINDRATRETLMVENGTYAARFHRPSVSVVAGNLVPRTKLAITVDQRGEVSAWDARDGRRLWELNAGMGALLSAEGGRTLLLEGERGRLMQWRHAPDRVFAELYSAGDNRSAAAIPGIEVSPGDRLIATRTNYGVILWDARERCYLRISVPPGKRIPTAKTAFSPDGTVWYVSRHATGTYRHSLAWAQDGSLRVGEPELVPGSQRGRLDALSPDGKTWVLCDERGVFQLWRPDGAASDPKANALLQLGPHLSPTLRFAYSYVPPVGQWVIFDARTYQPCGSHPGVAPGYGEFSPGEQWLVLREPRAYRFLETTTWQQRATVPCRAGRGATVAAAVSPDGTLAAVEQDRDVIELVSLPSGRLLVQLTPPQEIATMSLRFSHDSTRLYVLGLRHRLYEWNLAALHEELGKLGLAW
jgi:serine/threonine protein kinase/WD40 repeat protein